MGTVKFDFLTGFDITESPADQFNISLDLTEYTGNYGAVDAVTSNIITGGILKIDVDGTAVNAAGSLTLGAGNDAAIYFDGTDLLIHTDGAGASGIILDSEDDTVEIKGSGTLQATFSTSGLNLVSGDAYYINSTSVLNATTLGAGVLASSLTSVGTIATGVWQGTAIGIAYGGTGVALTDPGADRILVWDDSAGVVAWLTVGNALSVDATPALNFDGGATPGGELGGTWASPTVDATHSGSAHHDAVTLGDTMHTLSTQALSGAAASTTVVGHVEIAIASEINTGSDATRAVSPDALAGSNFGIRYMQCVVFEWATNNATGDGKFYTHVPPGLNGMNLVYVHAEVITAGTTNTEDIQIANVTQTADMLSTVLTIDSTETGSDTAATPAVIDTNNDDVATNDVLRIDVDAIHTTAAKGLIVTMGFQLP